MQIIANIQAVTLHNFFITNWRMFSISSKNQ